LKLVVDTNIILKALIRDSKVRAVLLNPEHHFYVPEFAFEEIERHMDMIVDKSGLSEEEVKIVLTTLSTNMRVQPAKETAKEWIGAEAIIGNIDSTDIAFVAAVLNSDADGIRSDDKDFKRQDSVGVWTTAEIMKTTD
jgi:predicted nucleic acid-binding protein